SARGSPSTACRGRTPRDSRRSGRTPRRCASGWDRRRRPRTPSNRPSRSALSRAAAAPGRPPPSGDRAPPSGPRGDERIAREEARPALLAARLGPEHAKVARALRAGLLVHVGDATRQGERLAGADRTPVLELLLAVHQRHEVEAELEKRVHAAGH